MNTAIAKTSTAIASSWQDKLEAVKSMCAPKASMAEFEVFCHTANQTGLDPLRRQIYMLNMGGGRHSIITGIDGFRLIANRSGKYAGQAGPFWCGPDGVWVDVWLKKEAPAASKVGVFKAGFAEPLWGVAIFGEYSKGVANWKSMPAVMIAKCAEALALRKAFPEDLSGVYTNDEMEQAVDVKAEPVDTIAKATETMEAITVGNPPQYNEAMEAAIAAAQQPKEMSMEQVAERSRVDDIPFGDGPDVKLTDDEILADFKVGLSKTDDKQGLFKSFSAQYSKSPVLIAGAFQAWKAAK